VERVSVSLTKEDKHAVEKIARERRVSIAWVVREAVIEFLSDAGREQASTAVKLKDRANS